MESLLPYLEKLEVEIKKIPFPQNPLYTPMEYLLGLGGKRIRPLLTLLGAELGGIPAEDSMNQAIAVELFHNFSLMHDDIMDRSELRRGSQTVHLKWDEPTAILSGDAMLVMAYQYLVKNSFDATNNIIDIFSKMAIEVCEGQMNDMRFENRIPSEEEYIDMIRQKTAVLLGASLQIGYLIGKNDREGAHRLYKAGVNWGIAFQIKDDYLDVFGSEKIGKKVGGDILANKKTVLYLTARNKANEEDKAALEKWFSLDSHKDITVDANEKIAQVTALYEKYNVGTYCLQLANTYFKKGNDLFNELVLPREARKTTLQLAEMLLERDS
jgi:geranylgeranyl diphosphate synthase, type II